MPTPEIIRHLSGLYAASDDPWGHRTSAYEAEKYRQTLAAIGPGPYREALEIGCGNGTLARLLAPRCQRLVAVDCIPAAIRAARAALADLPQVQVLQGAAPADLPPLRPDLVVLSEVLYFLQPAEIDQLGQWLDRNAQGPVVAVNWTGPTDEPLDGPTAVARLAACLGQGRTQHFEGFRIDVFAAG